MFCIRIMGPMLGFWMGSYFNKLYYNGDAPHGITPRDPMWIGRWWGGFLTIGGVLFLPSLLLFCFRNPKQPQTNETDEGKEVDKKRSRGLALVDRHLEKGENGKVLDYLQIPHFLSFLGCRPNQFVRNVPRLFTNNIECSQATGLSLGHGGPYH